MAPSECITPLLKQIWCASSVLIASFGQGMIMGHTSCLLAALQAPDSPIKTDINSASWLASAIGPFVFVGIISSCIVMDRFGRRPANLLFMLPGILGWTMVYLSQSYAVLLIGRLLTTITKGAVYTIGVIVIGEYTSPQNRGMFLNLKTAAFSSGSATAHILDLFMHWRTIAMVALIPHIITFLMTCTWPESPTWLATKKQYPKCEQVFFWLRGVNEKSVNEFSELIKAQKERLSQTKKKVCFVRKIQQFLRKFTRKDFLKPLLTLIVSFILMEATGRHYFPSYALQIMNEALNTKTLPHYYTLCIDLIIVFSCTFSSVLMRTMQRRTLLFSTGIASLIVLACLCSCLFLSSNNMISKVDPWIITFIFIVYFTLANLGCAPMPLSLQGELLPVSHRESGSAIFGVIWSLLLMGFVKVTPYILLETKVHGTFAIYGIVMAISLIILYFILPETKDKTLQEIENYYNDGKFSSNEEKDEVEIKMISDDQ